jgi:hypothetical protein
MKTIILVWTTKFNNLTIDNVNGFFGLGDIVRGTMSMFQLSKKYNFRLIVDIQLHPISAFLKFNSNEYTELIKNNKNNIPFFFPEEIENFVRNDPREVNFLFTNNHLIEEVSQECKNFIKNILLPKDEFAKHIHTFFKSENINLSYNILHFRLGDSLLVRNEHSCNFQTFIDKMNEYKEEQDILMSDSEQFKQYVKSINYNIKLLNTKTAHLGYEKHSGNIRDTLLEFFIITKAQYIKTFSIYRHLSGFVNIAHQVYDVPIERFY